MENLLLLRIELLVLFSSLWYSLYYTASYFYKIFHKVKNIVVSQKKDENDIVQTISINKEASKVSIKKTYDPTLKNLSEEEKVKITEILKRVKVHVEKGYYDVARTLIIEWLTIDKYNKELNLELAYIYEQEKNYKNAEFIYKDLCLVHKDNTVILNKLWYIVAMQWNLEESVTIYEKVHERKQWDLEVIEMLANLTYEVQDFEKAIKYINFVLKDKPKNIDFLKMKAVSLEWQGRLKDSIKVYEEILKIRPYDSGSIDNLRRLEQNIVNN